MAFHSMTERHATLFPPRWVHVWPTWTHAGTARVKTLRWAEGQFVFILTAINQTTIIIITEGHLNILIILLIQGPNCFNWNERIFQKCCFVCGSKLIKSVTDILFCYWLMRKRKTTNFNLRLLPPNDLFTASLPCCQDGSGYTVFVIFTS